MSNAILFPASVVGSMPRPDFVRDLISDENISADDYKTKMEAAVSYVISLQEQAGLDVVTDGDGGVNHTLALLPTWRTALSLGTTLRTDAPGLLLLINLSLKSQAPLQKKFLF